MPEGAMWIKDVAEIVKILSSTTNGVLDAIAEVDEGLATKLDDHVGNIMPVVRDMIDQMEDEESGSLPISEEPIEEETEQTPEPGFEDVSSPEFDVHRKKYGEEGSVYVGSDGKKYRNPWSSSKRPITPDDV
jgi:hypothetical protein